LRDNVKDSDDDEEDEDDDDNDGKYILVIDQLTEYRSAVWEFCRSRIFRIKVIILTILAVLYAIYFGFAVNHEFGSEPSVRLLWITFLVIAILLLSTLVCYLRPQLELYMSSSKPVNYIRQHHRRINWLDAAYFI